MNSDLSGRAQIAAAVDASAARRSERRLAALRRTGLLDAPPTAAFDRLTRLAAKVLHAPVALVSLVDADRQFFASCVGLPEPLASARETPLSHSFCQHTVTSGQPLIINDAREHPVLRENLAIPDLGVIAYAGIPLRTSDGEILGSFCVIDDHPRAWTTEEIMILTDLAGSVMTEIELRATLSEHEDLVAQAQAVRRQAEERAAQLAGTIEAMTDAVAIYDAEARLVMMSQATFTLFGLTVDPTVIALPEDLRSAHWHMRDAENRPIPVDDRPVRRVLRGETLTGDAAMAMRVHTLDGREIHVEASGAPLRDSTGAISGAVVAFRDVTAIRNLAQMREEFLSGIVHDLKTPLTSILGQAQFAKRRLVRRAAEDDAPTLNGLTRIEAAALRMVEMMNQLVDVARVGAGSALELQRTPVDLVALVRAMVTQQQSLAGQPIVLECPETSLEAVLDTTRIERVVLNLLVNAIKYSPDGTGITVHLGREERMGSPFAVLAVEDHGIGIPAADLPHVFDRFHRGTNVRGRFEGSGIGLASVKQIVEQHDGTITVTSHEGSGAAFTVSLPLAL